MPTLIKKLYGSVFLLSLLSLLFSSCRASNLTWSDLEFAHSQLEQYDSLEDIKSYMQKNKKTNYVLAYKAGLEHKEKKEYKSAVLMFAQAYFPDNYRESNNYFPAAIYEYISSLGTSLKSKSPLANFVLYELGECYYHLFENKFALKFLDKISTENSTLNENKIYLQARIYMRLDAGKALELLQALVKQNPSPVYHMNIGNLFYKQKNTGLALEHLFKALEFDKNAWSYKLAAREILSIVRDHSEFQKNFSNRQKIMLIEGHRLNEDYPDALKQYKEIQQVSPDDTLLYVHNAAKLYISLKQFERILELKPLLQNIKNADDFYTGIGNQLISQHRYYIASQLVPAFHPNKDVAEIRLRALNRIASNTKKAEAAFTLTKQNNNSSIGERVYFNECLPHLENKNYAQAKSCLQELAQMTVNAHTGGRARFYLGWVEQRLGNQSQAQQYYQEVYTNSPEHFFAFKALENVPSEEGQALPTNDVTSVRRWISKNFNNTTSMRKFFEKKSQDESYAIDPFWKAWQKDFDQLHKNLTDEELKAALFMLMGFSNLAQKYLSNTKDSVKKYLIHQRLGMKTQNPHQKYYYMRLYLRETGHDVDIFTCPNLVLEMMYPTPYYDIVKKQSERFNVEMARIYALMKQESMFHPRVGSSAGAQGLMQVMPSTARGLNQRENIANLDLRNPEHSIILGTRFYADMSRMFKGHFEKIAAAYNAGPGRLLEWQTRFAHLEDELFWEKIPFEETYLYIQLTRRFYDRYRYILRHRDLP